MTRILLTLAARFATAVLVLAALSVLLAWVLPTRVALLEREAMGQPALAPPDSVAEDRAQKFYAVFPTLDAAPVEIRTLAQLAAKHGIVLEQGEYRLAGEVADTLMRYEITLPIKAPYPAARGFIAEVLQALPNCSLDAVTFDRRKTGDALADAKIRFSLYLQERAQ